ncbi:hypothetical protein [Rhodoferax sp. GW822-FHT02A01]|uniref:hypothetical protein n=1 Tax=Rhodoferax sp. GW822-FHT02A01 TaxID=3141537 RepID=UPI00315D3A9D
MCPSANGPNEKAVNALAGNSTASQDTQQRDSSGNQCPSQMVPEIPNLFNRLARQYMAMGLGLYPLSGDTLLVSSPVLGMSRTLPDLRAAQIYLRQIGGMQ